MKTLQQALPSHSWLTGNFVFSARRQLREKEHLFKAPKTESYHKLLNVVEERASLQDGTYVDIQGHLKQFSKETFIEKKPMRHRGCYSEATNTMSIQRARDRLQHALSTGGYAVKKRGHKRHDLKWMSQLLVAQHLSLDLPQNLCKRSTASFVRRMMARICSQYELKMLERHFNELLKLLKIKY